MGFLSELFGYVLNWLYNLINNYGVAIIIFSILLRIILIPITIKQQKSMKKSAEMQTKLKEIQNKYKNNPEKLNQETIELYKKEKMSPFSGCLGSILQLIIILAVFYLVSQPLTFMRGVDKNLEDKSEGLIAKYTTEMQESNFNQNNSYMEIKLIDYAETKYQEVTKQLEELNFENVEESEENKAQNNKKVENKTENNKKTESKTENKDKEENKTENNEKIEGSEKENEENNEEVPLTKEELEIKRDEYNQLRLNMEFLGIDLSKVPTQSLEDWRVYIIPVLYVITSFISIKLTTMTQNKKKKSTDIIVEKDGEQKEEEVDPMDQMQSMNKGMSFMMPLMSVMIAVIAPLGLALYWLVSNILMIIERLAINKFMEMKENKEEQKEEEVND